MNLKHIYRKIAKENNTTVADVKREMQFAINEAYNQSNVDSITKCYQNQVPKKGTTPTTDEII